MRRSQQHAREPGPPDTEAMLPAPVHGIGPTSERYPYQRAEDAGEIVEAFAVTGGRPYFRSAGEFPNLTGNEIEAGVQLCAYQYIPVGFVGFVKGVVCAPYLGTYFRTKAANGVLDEIAGVWQTPIGWEAMVDANGGRPAWRWLLRVIPGTLEDAQKGNNPLLTAFLVPNVPIPQSPTYGGTGSLRLPGRAAGKRWSDNRLQRYFGTVVDDQVHVVIPEDTTVMAFAVWTQPSFPLGQEAVKHYALGPSFGSLVGYMQRNARPRGQESARKGWR